MSSLKNDFFAIGNGRVVTIGLYFEQKVPHPDPYPRNSRIIDFGFFPTMRHTFFKRDFFSIFYIEILPAYFLPCGFKEGRGSWFKLELSLFYLLYEA